VPESVAVGAQEVTLRGFGHESFPGSVEVADTEVLRFRIPVMKLQRGDADVIAAVFAPAASDFDKTLLTLNPPPSLTAVRRLVPPLSSISVRSGPCSDRSLGRVVRSER